MVQSDDPNSPNFMCCRAALMTDCLIKREAMNECRGITGYEEIPQRIRKSIMDPAEIWKIQAVLTPPRSGGRIPGTITSLEESSR